VAPAHGREPVVTACRLQIVGRMMMKRVKKLLGSAGDTAMDVVDRVGPKRGLIGLGVLALAIGGSLLAVRFVRGRRAAALDEAPAEPRVPTETFAKRGGHARRGGHAQASR
jgi:hypothetical protein